MLEEQQQQRVSLAELLEVRSAGLSAPEILTLLASACEHLIRAANRRGLFTAEQIFLTRDGRIEIQLVPIGDVPRALIPPELVDQQQQPFGQGTSDSHLVWCLGKSCAQASAADHSDVALFSLLNLMTVGHLQTRPSLQKVRQMVRNRLDVVDADRMHEVIAALYREVLGDLCELIEDPFNDDIRFHSSRSSQLSIIPGPGAPEYRETRDLDVYQQELATEVVNRLRRDFSLSRKHSQTKEDDKGELAAAESPLIDENLDIPDRILTSSRKQQQRPVPSPRRGFSPVNKKGSAEEEEEAMTPRGPSPTETEEMAEEFVPITGNEIGNLLGHRSSELEWRKLRAREEQEKKIPDDRRNNPFFDDTSDDGPEPGEEERAMKTATNSALRRPNSESIQVEVHSSPQPPSASAHHHHRSDSSNTDSTAADAPSSSSVQQQPPKSARLYAKAGQTATSNSKLPRGAGVKRAPEIEILPMTSSARMKDDEEEEEEYYKDDEEEKEEQQRHPPPSSSAISAVPPLPAHGLPATLPKQSPQPQDGQFHRQNSLQPARCSRRASTGGKQQQRRMAGGGGGGRYMSGLPAVPEFLSTQPSIRLRAQSMKRKKTMMLSLHRAEPAVVFVLLLNGQRVEVNCKTDQLVGAVFHTVAEHLDLTEHIFFGLVLQQQPGEFIFLEEEHRLEKWAPPGWKHGAGLRRSFGAGDSAPRSPLPASAGEQFILHLRFRYYPKKREFVKTATTAHQLYLQLRQDMLSGALRFQPREKALEMAALALCVECGQPPTAPGDYFKLENYLPSKFYDLEPGDILPTQRELAAQHARFAQQMGRLEAEERFICLCQAEPYYGAHFHWVHKMKPKRGQQPFFGDARLVAIMPSGLGICREERGAARRLFTSLYEWHHIRTLQFDRKRFLLGTVENGIAVDHVFYTDHHSKAAYLVQFAASQHRFMLKMRQWQGTLNRVRAMQRHKDVGVDQQGSGQATGAGNSAIGSAEPRQGQEQQQNTASATPIFAAEHRRTGSSQQPQMGISGGTGTTSDQQRMEEAQHQQLQNRQLVAETDTEYIKYCYGPDAQRVDVVLEKHPELGLGLTLVDGAVNGVKGVYVKSVSADGDGRRKGLLIGDCLLSVNGTSLFNRTRHDAVELVSASGRQVRLELLRFPSISEVLAQEPTVLSTLSGTATTGKTMESKEQVAKKNEEEAVAQSLNVAATKRRTSNTSSSSFRAAKEEAEKAAEAAATEASKRKQSTLTNKSRTSADSAGGGTPQSGLSIGSSSAQAQHRRQRAVSDFGGAFGGHLPALRTDDILAATAGVTPPKGRRAGAMDKDMDEHRAQRYRRHKTSAGFAETRTSDSSEEEDEESTDSDTTESGRPGIRRQNGGGGGNNANTNPSSGGTRGEYLPSRMQQQLPPVSAMYGTLEDDDEEEEDEEDELMSGKRRANGQQKQLRTAAQNTENAAVKSSPFSLNMSTTTTSANNSPYGNSPFAAAVERYGRHNSNGGVGAGNWSNGKGGNEQKMTKMTTTNLDWTNELSDFDSISSPPDSSTRQREKEVEEDEEQMITVILNKTAGAINSPIGLSLAKRMGHEGVFVRNVAPDSLAAQEGTLRVGDRIWRLQGTEMAPDESPASVVKKLREADSSRLEIQVKRQRKMAAEK